MKHRCYNILPLLILCFFSSCIVEEETIDPVDGQLVHKVFTATFEESDMTTKTMLDGNVGEDGIRGLLWDPEDEIGVAQYNYDYQCFRNTIPYASSNGVFEGSVGQGQFYYAVYPYQGAMVHRTNINVTIPTVQTYRENSFDRNVAPMVGQGKDGEPLHFMNICGVLAVQLTGSEIVKSIVFETKNGEKVSGVCSVDTDYVEYPLLDATAATETYVILDCGEGVQLSSEATPFHIVLPPGTYNGFTLYITTADGKFMKQETSKTLAIKRSIVTKAASFDFENNMTEVTNLSEHGHSNCYIVPAAGIYSFDADVIGNGEFGLIPGAGFHANNTTISPASVELVWEDRLGLIVNYVLDISTGKIKFMTSGKEGNALLAAKGPDGTILWSWHIWMTDEPVEQTYVNNTGTYVMLDRNIGAIRSDRGNGEEWKDASGVQYQWGRKDPFIYDSYNGRETSIGLEESIQNPTDFAYGNNQWVNSFSRDFWSPSQKTIYDPCPVGYRVPVLSAWTGFTTDGYSTSDVSHMRIANNTYDYGLSFYTHHDSEDEIAWYPSTHQIGYWGGFSWSEGEGYCWAADNDGYNSGHLRIWNMYVGLNEYTAYTVCGYSVRCMKDEGHKDISTYVEMEKLLITDVGLNSVTLSAGYRYGISTTVSEKGFIYGTSADLSGEDTKTVAVEDSGNDFSCTLTELAPATRYYVRAYMINENGTYLSDVVRFATTSEDGAINLSHKGTANSYMISDVGSYMFDCTVKGNSEETVNGVSVDLIWEVDRYRDVRENQIINLRLENGWIKFDLVNAEHGNALIAVKDDNGTIVWSWHIWITGYDPANAYHIYHVAAGDDMDGYKVMDRNLGASQSDPDYENLENTWELTVGMLYQWGRKDPMIYDLLTDTHHTQFGTMEEAIANPKVFAQGEHYWMVPFDYSLWSNSSKTKYDPCPIGWRVAPAHVYNHMSQSQVYNPYGITYSLNTNYLTWFGYGDYIHSGGDHFVNQSQGFLWTSSILDDYNGASIFYYNGNHYQNSNYYTDAYPVRCMKDE